jgi:2'-5' RNA ligase superfamily
MGETAVVVRVPEAEPAVGRHRREHTPSGADGMPAHVTVTVPFADSTALGAGMVGDLRETLVAFSPFRFGIRRLARFAGPPTVLYGAPEPAAPFVCLTERLCDRFGFPPYGGRHTTVTPHLTIATRLADAEIDRIEADVEPWLPIECRADACEVWEHTDRGWRMMHAIPLR